MGHAWTPRHFAPSQIRPFYRSGNLVSTIARNFKEVLWVFKSLSHEPCFGTECALMILSPMNFNQDQCPCLKQISPDLILTQFAEERFKFLPTAVAIDLQNKKRHGGLQFGKSAKFI